MKITINSFTWLLTVSVLAGCLGFATRAHAAEKKVLVVTVTKGFRHSSIPTAEKVIGELAKKSGDFTVEYAGVDPNDAQYKGPEGKPDQKKVDDAIKAVLAEKMSLDALKKYDAVIFANTTGDLPLPDKEGFLNWIKSGKGFVGMHSATDTFRGHKPLDSYVEMLGAEFKEHHAQARVDAINQDPQCGACKDLPANWNVFDEMYLFNGFERAKVHGLLTMDKHPNDKTPGDFPIAWCKNYGQGRVFYTSLGHREDMWDPNTPPNFKRENSKEVAELYQKHILSAIRWAIGLEKWDIKP